MHQLLDEIASRTVRTCLYELGYSERKMLMVLGIVTDSQLLAALLQVNAQERRLGPTNWLARRRKPDLACLHRLKEAAFLEGNVESRYCLSGIGRVLCREVIPAFSSSVVSSPRDAESLSDIATLLAGENGFKMLKLLFMRPWSMSELEQAMMTLAEFSGPAAQQLERVGLAARSLGGRKLAITLRGRRVYQGLMCISEFFRVEEVV